MLKTKPIAFHELRRLLERLDYKEKRTDTAHVFHRAGSDLLFFRRYEDKEMVDLGDLVSTRKFLDSWGLLEARDFDEFLNLAATPA